MSVQRYIVRAEHAHPRGTSHAEPNAVNQEWCRAEDVARLEARNAELEAEVARLKQVIAGEVDPLLAASGREQIRAELVQQLAGEVARLREEATGVVEAWDWWLVDTSDRCRSVPQDAVESLRTTLEAKS